MPKKEEKPTDVAEGMFEAVCKLIALRYWLHKRTHSPDADATAPTDEGEWMHDGAVTTTDAFYLQLINNDLQVDEVVARPPNGEGDSDQKA